MISADTIKQIQGKKAARAILDSRARKSSLRGITKTLSCRQASRIYDVSTSEVFRQLKNLESGSSDTPRPQGRPRALTHTEDDAIAAYVMWMERAGFPASKLQVEEAANSFRLQRDPESSPLSRAWYPQFRKDHPELRSTFLKAVEKSRKSFESSDIADITTFYKELEDLIKIHRIGASEIWNEDEAGIRLGCLRETLQVLVMRTTRASRPEVLDPANRESCTLIGAGNAVGDSIPPWLIFKSFATENFASIEADDNMRFVRTDTAFSNADVTFDWLHEFNRVSWTKSAQASRLGVTLNDWFGCDEWKCVDGVAEVEVNEPPNHHDEKIWRLLVIDGFTGHSSFKFIEYCIQFDILIVMLPPHSTHIMQPMDVGVFQPLKHAHQAALRKSLQEGNLAFNRIDFVSAFQKIFDVGFSRHNIMSGFEKTGLFPSNNIPVITKLVEAQRKQRDAVNPAFESLLPPESRFQGASDTVQHIDAKYSELLSSPSRAALQQVCSVVHEAAILNAKVAAFCLDRTQHIDRLSRIHRRGKSVKPGGRFITSSSLAEIRQQQEETLKVEAEKGHRRELRSHRTTLKKEMDKLREKWRSSNKEAEVGGVMKKIPVFKKWLEVTGFKDHYLDMENTSQKYLDLLRQHNNGFIIDTKPDPRVQAAIRKLKYTAKPLSEATELTALQHELESDASLSSTNLGYFNDEDDYEEDLPEPENDTYDGVESGDNDDIEIITETQEMQPWERSSPPVTWAEEVDGGPETPCPQPRTQHRESTYKHIKKDLETFRDRLRKRNDLRGRDTI